MLKLWNFSSTLGRPNNEEKERKRRLREAQLTQIHRELTLDRKLISGSGPAANGNGPWVNKQSVPKRAKTFRHQNNAHPDPQTLTSSSNGQFSEVQNGFDHVSNSHHLRYRSKSSHKLDEDSQFVSRLRFFDDTSSSSNLQSSASKRHSTAFLTPDDDQRLTHDLYGMRRRYTTAFDSEDTDFTVSTTDRGHGGRNNIVTFANTPSRIEQRLRFSDQTGDMSITSGTNRSSYGGTSDDGFGDYRSETFF